MTVNTVTPSGTMGSFLHHLQYQYMPSDLSNALAAPAPPRASQLLVAATLFLLPAIGFPGLAMVPDTLKSAVLAFGVLLAGMVFFWQHRRRHAPLHWHGLMWLPLALMAYALGSMLWSHAYLAGAEAIRWCVLGLLMWLALNTVNRSTLPLVLWGVHGGAVVASVWAVLQFWLGFDVFPQAALPASTFVNRNFFAEYLVCTLPLSVYLLAQARASRWLSWIALSLALNIVALMMTGTRSALVALLILLPVLAVALLKYRQQWGFSQWGRATRGSVCLVLLAGVLGLGSLPSGNPRIAQEGTATTALQRSYLRTASIAVKTEYTEGSFSVRSVMWKATARMLMAHPLIGVGAGAWEVQIPLYQNSSESLETDYYAHNEYLQLLSEYGGVTGGLCLAFVLAYLLLAAHTTWRLQGEERTEGPLRACVLASLLALGVVSLAGFPWHMACTAALLALCLALLAGSDVRLKVRAGSLAGRPSWRPAYSRIALGVLAGCTVLALYLTHRAAMAERTLVQALQLADRLVQADAPQSPEMQEVKARMLAMLREGVALNPYYRKFTPMAAEVLTAQGDWANVAWILQSVVDSHPNVPALWQGLALAYAQLHDRTRALQALAQVQRLRPDTLSTRNLEIVVLSNVQQDAEAARQLRQSFDAGHFDYALAQAGYALGLKTHDLDLAIRSLELRNRHWPEQAADGYFRMGKVYAEATPPRREQALLAFTAGLAAVPAQERANYRQQVPVEYRTQLQK